MKKYILPIIVVVAIAAYIIWNDRGTNPTPAATPSEPTTPATTTAENTPATSTPTSTTGTPAASNGKYTDGTYTGKVADAFYGNLQVAAVISGGKLTDVTFIQFPNDQGESALINGKSNPVLKQEAIASQSANVNVVSGATQSSEAFNQSLASALAQAMKS